MRGQGQGSRGDEGEPPPRPTNVIAGPASNFRRGLLPSPSTTRMDRWALFGAVAEALNNRHRDVGAPHSCSLDARAAHNGSMYGSF